MLEGVPAGNTIPRFSVNKLRCVVFGNRTNTGDGFLRDDDLTGQRCSVSLWGDLGKRLRLTTPKLDYGYTSR